MYDAWLYYGEFLVLGIWGILLTLVRRILFGKLCKDAALGGSGKGKMLKQMTLKFEQSSEVNVGIHDLQVFVQKYLCQEKRLGVCLYRWKRLPERWAGLVLCVGLMEAMVLRFLGYDNAFCLDRLLASAMAAVLIRMAILWFESDSLWERAGVFLLDYVSNTLYPRQIHEYESFGQEEAQTDVPEASGEAVTAGEGTAPEREKIRAETAGKVSAAAVEKAPAAARKEKKKAAPGTAKKGVDLKKEEEQIFQEVLSDFLGSST